MTDLVEVGKAKAAGIVSILLGMTALMDIICGVIYYTKGGVDGSGIWTGVALAMCAGLGLITWWKRNKLAMVFFLVLDILSFIVCGAGVIFALLVWIIFTIIRRVIEKNCHTTDAGICHCSGENDVPIKIDDCDDIRMIERLLLAIVVLNGLGAALALAGSIIGCMGTCCARQIPANVVLVERSEVVMQPAAGVPPPDYPMTVVKK